MLPAIHPLPFACAKTNFVLKQRKCLITKAIADVIEATAKAVTN